MGFPSRKEDRGIENFSETYPKEYEVLMERMSGILLADEEFKDRMNLFEKAKSEGKIPYQGLTKSVKISSALADVIGVEKVSRSKCIQLLWDYLKKHNLQHPMDPSNFIPDEKMAKVFGKEKCRAFGMAKFLDLHILDYSEDTRGDLKISDLLK